MRIFIFSRVVQLIPMLLGITFLSFSLMFIAGSDVVIQKYDNAGIFVPQALIDAERARLGLDQPFFIQYFKWLGGLVTGEMGNSFVTGKNVFDTFLSKLPATLFLAFVAILLTIIFSIPLGIVCAVKQDGWCDYIFRFLSFAGNSMPNFFVALLLMYFISIKLNWLPVISRGVNVQSVILPGVTLAIAMSAKYLRQVRAAVLDELGKDYVVGERARGVFFNTTIYKSVLRSSCATIITLLAMSIGSLLGGTAIVESIFMWDGVGRLAVDAINMRDYPMIQAYVVWMAIIYVCVNLTADILYGLLDPRIRMGYRQT